MRAARRPSTGWPHRIWSSMVLADQARRRYAGLPSSRRCFTSFGKHSVISAPSGVSDASGVVTFTVKDATAEAVVYTAKDTTDNVTLTQTATVTFTP